MKKLDQKGFSVVEVLVVIVIVGLIGAVGWLVYDRQSNKNSTTGDATQQSSKATDTTSSTEEPKGVNDCNDSSKRFESKKIGVAFCHPNSWKVATDDTANYDSITLTSTDYNEVQGGFGGSKTGSKVYITVSKISELQAAYVPVSKILDGTEQGKSTYTSVEAITIDGHKGATFKQSYEGPAHLTNAFEHKGYMYELSLEADLDGPDFNDNQDEYKELVESFQLVSK